MENEQHDEPPFNGDLKERQLGFLSHSKALVRANAVKILSTCYSADAEVYSRIATLATDRSVRVRKYVVTAFARMKRPESVPDLCHMVRDSTEDENLRWQAAAVLGTFPDNEAVNDTIPSLIASPQSLENYLGLALLRSQPHAHQPVYAAFRSSPRFHSLGLTESSWRAKQALTTYEPAALDHAVRERALGSIWGAAIGDAMGGPIEFMSLQQIKNSFGKVSGYTQRSPKRRMGKTSDDTFFNLAVLRCIAQPHGFTPDTLAGLIGETVRSIDQGAPNPGIGPNTIRAGRLLYAGVDWKNLPFSYDTCGGAIRVVSLGAVYHEQPDLSRKMAYASSKVTHNHPDAIAGAVAAAAAVGYAINAAGNLDPHAFLSYCAESCRTISPAVADKIQSIESYLGKPAEQALHELGTRNKAIDVVPAALCAFLSSPDDFRQAIMNAIHVDGDSDSIGSIAGGISGAYLGLGAIPKELHQGLQERETIQKTLEDCLTFQISFDLESILQTGRITPIAQWTSPPKQWKEVAADSKEGVMYNSMTAQAISDLLSREFGLREKDKGAAMRGSSVHATRVLQTPGGRAVSIKNVMYLNPDETRLEKGTILVTLPEDPSCQGMLYRLSNLKEYIEGRSNLPFVPAVA